VGKNPIDPHATLSFNLKTEEVMTIAYTVKEVARMSGVSVRTLHYYDEIGLLRPAFYGENGYRYYENEQLLRLQQIMFFRELDFKLDEIQTILDHDAFNQIEALQSQRHLLEEKINRLQKLIQTIDRTVAHLKGEINMQNEEMYYGFDKAKQDQYIKELRERYGSCVEGRIKESQQRMKNWKKEDYSEVKSIINQIHRYLTSALHQGMPVESKEVQAIIQRHFEWINRFYTADKEFYQGLGNMYVEHPDFRKLYDSYHPKLAEYMRAAMRYFAKN
jgi:DNA-binding transcriptional MerR regulator